ncbi:MAG TPA: hypothetical protein VKB58_09475 [Terriglobales bacterium]|nr:hypothetical protein [Terriglobales bacterium]
MQGLLPLIVALLVGIVGGAVVVNILVGSRIKALLPEAQRSEQNSLFNQPFSSSNYEIVRQRDEIQALRTKLVDSSTQLDKAKQQCTHLEQQVAKVPDLEKEIAELQARMLEATGQTDLFKQETKAAEAEKEEARVAELEQQAARVPELEELAARVAEFEQQVARVSELEEQQKTDSAEMELLNKEIASLKEKLEASAAKAEEQQKAVESLEAAKNGLSTEHDELVKERDQLLKEQEELKGKMAELTASIDAEREEKAEKLALLERAKEQLAHTLQCLTGEVVHENGEADSAEMSSDPGVLPGNGNVLVVAAKADVRPVAVAKL